MLFFLLLIASGISSIFSNYISYVILYMLANVNCIIGVLFLFGPLNMLRNSYQSVCNGIMCFFILFFFVMELVSTFFLHDGGLCLVFNILRFQLTVVYVIKMIEDIISLKTVTTV